MFGSADRNRYGPPTNTPKIAKDLAKKSGAHLTITDDVNAAVKGVDFIHTDVWVSMGEPKEVWKRAHRAAQALPGEPGADEGERQSAGQVHALPARVSRHRDGPGQADRRNVWTSPTALEVTDDVFESEANVAFEQAENRMHTIKALLVATLGD